ncbi:MAG: PorV/PorQ family protein, partial [bacterium]|nr:PorV/PorQ family protein [bacterium]
MGKTFVGIADDASTTYWNPAGLATLAKPEITALYASLYEKTGYSFASGVLPLKLATSDQRLGTVGVAIVNLSSRGFQLRDEYNYELGEGGVSETAAIVSYGTKVQMADSGWQMAVGANAKIVNQNINTHSDTGYGVDLGFLWKPDSKWQTADGRLKQILKPLTIGLSIQNIIAPKLTLIEETDTYPLAATLGFSYRFFNDTLLTAIDLNKTENRQVKAHLGTEYTLAKLFSIRAGLDETEATLGMGVQWQNYSLDYAFAYHDAWKGYEDLGMSHRFGLTVRFGK